MMRSRLVIVISILCLVVTGLVAQETYQLEFVYNSDSTARSLEMYKFDFFSGEGEHVFSLDTSRLPVEKIYTWWGSTREYEIVDFEMSHDRRSVYILETSGHLFQYFIAEDSVEYLRDLSPLEPDHEEASRWDNFIIHTGLFWLTDDILYAYGVAHNKYYISSDSAVLLWRPYNFSDGFENENQRLYFDDCVRHQGRVLCMHSAVLWSGIGELDPDDPQESTFLVGFDSLSGKSLVSYHYDCDSVVLYGADYLSGPESLHWYAYDPYTGNQEVSHEKPPFFSDNVYAPSRYTEVKHYNAVPIDYCIRSVDLDEDDDTAPGLDYAYSADCAEEALPLSDVDVRIRQDTMLDSLVVEIVDPVPGQELSFMAGNYGLEGNLSDHVVLHSIPSTSVMDLEQALRDARLFIGSSIEETVEIAVTPWSLGLSGASAIARIELAGRIPVAGEDTRDTLCAAGSLIDLSIYLGAGADAGGLYLDAGENVLSTPMVSPSGDEFLFYYVVGNDRGCSDTSVHSLRLSRHPAALNLGDLYLCAGESVTIDLSGLSGSLSWMDGSTDVQRELNEAGAYALSYRDTLGCHYSTSFELEVSQAPEQYIESVMICAGEEYVHQGQIIDEAGLYLDTVQGLGGCDSVYFGVDISIYEPEPIDLKGDSLLCPGEKIYWEVVSSHSDILINGEEMLPLHDIDAGGMYEIEAYDQNGCPTQRTVEVLEASAPVVTLADSWDTVYQEGIRLEPMYSADIHSYAWEPSSDLSCSDCPYPDILGSQGGIYTVAVQNAAGCRDTARITVHIREGDYYLANVLGRQSEDNRNRVLYVQSREEVSYSLKVYNRWGSLIYDGRGLRSNNPNQGWRPEEDRSSGVYVYEVVIDEGARSVQLVGNVTIL